MKLTRISEIRRSELRRAAFEVLQTEGTAGTTLEKVAQHAGASKGIVLHYFRNKQELFEQAMREANKALGDLVTARLGAARTQDERLWAIIETNFDPRFFQPAVAHAWLSLCAEVPREPQLARIQKVIHGRMRSNLISSLKGLVDGADIETVALSITALIDGLWLRLGLQGGSLTPQKALHEMRDYLKFRLKTN
jgi:TetR/AcrR family transcriptional repressor of bet genes